jgi:hypothetical protein
MARILRRLQVSEISSVDVAANRGARVVLRKRAAEPGGRYAEECDPPYTPEQARQLAGNHSVIGEAERALEASLRSIVGDATVVEKRAAVAESVAQFRQYLHDKNVGEDAIDAAIGGVVGKHLEVHMVDKSSSSRCRHCGGKDPLGDDGDDAMDKADVQKISQARIASIGDGEGVRKAIGLGGSHEIDVDLSKVLRDERARMFGEAYRMDPTR